ncbi:GDP dissociation inhibitor family protein [Histomonas meleagridis]|uniref:GDP dissociation inhibitor family protein n=1 Tax=Histomonas meleagridis TaxID=135588 RepID=UPI00355A4983|nr:GDP dissociation inhibitor family protein [Histomonas meleagridis]KAH0805194.1 GDP dissociation inhibitor family protein [Histomonas meleagridis]
MEGDNYDVIACGTGFKECLLSGLLSVARKKVLHVDRNDFYGADCASLNITQFFQKFFHKDPPAELGPNRDWNIDLIPKFIMADGLLVKVLIHTKVNDSLNFQLIAGSYVYKNKKVDKVPSTSAEAFSTSLVGLLEKRRLASFLEQVTNIYDNPSDPKHAKVKTMTAQEFMKSYGLDPSTMTFIGHAMCLEPDDQYLKRSANELIDKMALYGNSISKFKNQNSPYLYPMYGLGDLPQAFARLCAVWGGTYMLNTPVDNIIIENGRAVGIESNGKKAYAPVIIGDPSYFAKIPGKTKTEGRIVRAICLLNQPIKCLGSKNKVDSANIIIPQTEVGRKHDIYVCFTSYQQRVCPQGWYVALVSTTVETDKPEAELKPGLDLLGKIAYQAVEVQDVYIPQIPGSQDGMYCSSSYDPTTHFETTIAEVLDLYEQIMGKPVNFDED